MAFSQENARNELVEAGCVPVQAEVVMRAVDESRDGYVTMDAVQALIKNLNELSNGQVKIWAELEPLRNDQTAIRTEQERLGNDQAAIREDVKQLRDDQAAIRTEQGRLRHEQIKFRGDMNTRFAEFKGEVTTELAEMENRLFANLWKAIGTVFIAGAAVVAIITWLLSLFA